MALSHIFTFSGIEFNLTVGCGQEDGVTIYPDKHDLSEPRFLMALQQALNFHPVFYAYGYIQNCCYKLDEDHMKRDVRGIPDDALEYRYEQYKLLIAYEGEQHEITPTGDMLLYGQALHFEVERRKQKAVEKARKTTKAIKPGYVYLLNEINGVHFKIGRTTNPKQRVKTFSVKLPYKVEFEAVIQTDDMHGLEAQLHQRFADKRVDGEWFALEPEDVAYIKSLAGGA